MAPFRQNPLLHLPRLVPVFLHHWLDHPTDSLYLDGIRAKRLEVCMEGLHRQLAKVAESGTIPTFEFEQPTPKFEVPVSLPLAKRPKRQRCL
jgi:hypothetical protein